MTLSSLRRVLVVKTMLLAAGCSQFAAGARDAAWEARWPLHAAARYDKADRARELLEQGANPDSTDDHFVATPLHVAAAAGSIGVLEVLVGHGGNVNAFTNVKFGTPLQMAVANGQTAAAEWMLDHGGDPNVKGPMGGTALHLACTSGNARITTALIQHGAAVNAQDDIARAAPLHYCALHGLSDVAEVLLAAGADVSARSDENLTPLKLATKMEYQQMVDLLQRYGAKE